MQLLNNYNDIQKWTNLLFTINWMKRRKKELSNAWKKKHMWLTSARFCIKGAAMKTTYGANSAVLSTFNAWGSTSNIATFPSWWIFLIVSSLVPYIASSWVPTNTTNYKVFCNSNWLLHTKPYQVNLAHMLFVTCLCNNTAEVNITTTGWLCYVRSHVGYDFWFAINLNS